MPVKQRQKNLSCKSANQDHLTRTLTSHLPTWPGLLRRPSLRWLAPLRPVARLLLPANISLAALHLGLLLAVMTHIDLPAVATAWSIYISCLPFVMYLERNSGVKSKAAYSQVICDMHGVPVKQRQKKLVMQVS